MLRTLKSGLHWVKVRWYRRRIERVLGQVGRGEARCDGLQVNKVSNRLEIHWQARDIHHWDRDLPVERRAAAFVEQTLADTEAAISKLFDAMPQVDVIDLTVLDPSSDTPMLAGTVHRSVVAGSRRLLSVRMRLRELGVNYRLSGSHFSAVE